MGIVARIVRPERKKPEWIQKHRKTGRPDFDMSNVRENYDPRPALYVVDSKGTPVAGATIHGVGDKDYFGFEKLKLMPKAVASFFF